MTAMRAAAVRGRPPCSSGAWPRLPCTIQRSTLWLADAIGNADLAFKAHEAQVKALTEEFKARGILAAEGEHFTVNRSDQVASRLDVAAVKQFLGDAWRKFEIPSITTVVRIKAVQRIAAA
jgi:hypothetical protein